MSPFRYNLTTFDMIGDLALGQSFDGLTTSTLHTWVRNIFGGVKFLVAFRFLTDYPLFSWPLLTRPVVKLLNKAAESHRAHTHDTVAKRLADASKAGRADFVDSMLRYRAEDDPEKKAKNDISDAEIESNMVMLLIAGSETTATLLSGVTYLITRPANRAIYTKLVTEIRRAFASEAEITFDNATARLPYMLAVLDEGLRMYPPIPTGLQRITLPDQISTISGHAVPPRTTVSVHQSGSYWSATNFARPHDFVPERFTKKGQEGEFRDDNRAVFQPFSVGPRNCIGKTLAYNEMRLILARVLYNFDIEACEESEGWTERQQVYILWEKIPLWCRLKRREEI